MTEPVRDGPPIEQFEGTVVPRSSRLPSIILTSAIFLAALFPLPILFFFLPFDWAWDLVYSVFPTIAPNGAPAWLFYLPEWIREYWSFLVWVAVAVGFAWTTRRLSIARRVAIGGAVIIGTIVVFRVVIHALGWHIFVDTL